MATSATESVSPKPLNLAIIGGGIAGTILSISLTKHGIQHTLYESAAQFGEIGAGVGFQPTFVRTMELISPEIKDAFLRCAEAPYMEEDPIYFTVRVGDCKNKNERAVVARRDGREIRVGEKVFDWPARRGPGGGVHRAHLLDELVKLIPDHVPKFRKRLVDIEEADDGTGDAVLHFADGTTARHDAVLGCDGIKSRTREIVLGKEEAKAVFSGKCAYRGLISMEKAAEILGEETPKTAQMFCGHHGHVLTFPIAKGTMLNIVAFTSRESWTNPDWIVNSSKEDILADFATWSPDVKALLSSIEKTDIWALFNHPSARTYIQSSPRICLVGDAAHASTPHQGAGAGMCVEDCYILGELLGEITDAHEIDKAFQAYEDVRRLRSLKLVKTSKEAGLASSKEDS
ncbi:FAD/NAD(P)-binding domain-containing protein [Westerdykella ornata]|uniref:FAD/NAD(P)-binding domain-containing protein n=1 Tax=Westerdykella ornata TaxID=318751 RepID=A0A6A6JIT0_WESOR|nr:FAD/NAD(P)-binding domain-containing protein [Westerdykella ornata]KAF2276134.1 FAD/NAD(P)-binding domain-containing protein [Westerdykella ornata]